MAAAAWREEGNRLYKSALENVPHLIRVTRLRKALTAYNSSLAVSISPDDLSSVYKNLAMTSFRLYPLEDTSQMKIFQLVESSKYFGLSKVSGQDCKSPEWLASLKKSYSETVEAMKAYCRKLPLDECIRQLSKYAKVLDHDEIYVGLVISILEMQFNKSMSLMDDRQYDRSSSAVQDCNYFLEEALRYCDDTTREICLNYRARISKHVNLCEAYLSLAHGNKLVACFEDLNAFSLNSDNENAIFSVLDAFKKAVLLSRGEDQECEAVAQSRIGIMYWKLFKNKRKATEYLKSCIALADTLAKQCEGEDWYIEATNGLSEIKLSERSVKELKAEFLASHRDILQELDRRLSQGTKAYLMHIYTQHPPKKVTYVLPEVNSLNVRNLLKVAMKHYHPDKQKSNPQDWQFLCEHITLGLTEKFEESSS